MDPRAEVLLLSLLSFKLNTEYLQCFPWTGTQNIILKNIKIVCTLQVGDQARLRVTVWIDAHSAGSEQADCPSPSARVTAADLSPRTRNSGAVSLTCPCQGSSVS